jgi:hypothetical protein
MVSAASERRSLSTTCVGSTPFRYSERATLETGICQASRTRHARFCTLSWSRWCLAADLQGGEQQRA